MLRFQFSLCYTFKNKKQSEYPFSIFEVHITLGFKSESFLIYWWWKEVKIADFNAVLLIFFQLETNENKITKLYNSVDVWLLTRFHGQKGNIVNLRVLKNVTNIKW